MAFEVASAGTEPKGVNPLTVRVLAEVGIDITSARSKSVTEFLDQRFDYVITVCDQAREGCPVFPGAHQSLHWGFDDPAAADGDEAGRLEVFRRVMTRSACTRSRSRTSPSGSTAAPPARRAWGPWGPAGPPR